jgi:hypothetical protein
LIKCKKRPERGTDLMDMLKIIDRARKKDIEPATMNKTELIRAIQIAEGHSECFATKHITGCEEIDCSWRGDCIRALLIQHTWHKKE